MEDLVTIVNNPPTEKKQDIKARVTRHVNNLKIDHQTK